MTAQATETLIFQGERLSLCSEPLGKFLEFTEHPIQFMSMSTANWRGYIGTWRIQVDRLYLIRLRGTAHDGDGFKEISLKDIFPDFPQGVFAHWYTGTLRCPKGGRLQYVHMGYASKYEEDLMFQVNKGVVTKSWVIKNGTAEESAPKGYDIAAYTTFGHDLQGNKYE